MKVYYCSIQTWKDIEWNLWGLEKVSLQRQQKVARYKQHADKVRCLVAGLLLRYAFGDVALQDALLGEYGKPYFPACAPFSLSHAGDYVVLAVAEPQGGLIGVDVERVKDFSWGVAKKCFAAQELAWLQSFQDTAQQQQAFYTLWTGKESVLKATGQGFFVSPNSFSLVGHSEEYSNSGDSPQNSQYSQAKQDYQDFGISETSQMNKARRFRSLCVVEGKLWHVQWQELPSYMLCVASEICAKMEFVILSKEELLDEVVST